MSDIKKAQHRDLASMPKTSSGAPVLKLLPSSPSTAVNPSGRVAILVGEGADVAAVKTIYTELLACGLAPCLVSDKPGGIAISDNLILDVGVFVSAEPPILFDAVVIADGVYDANKLNGAFLLEFVRQHYNRCTPILAIGAASLLLAKSDVLTHLPSGLSDPTIIISTSAQLKKAIATFKAMLPE